MLTADAHQKITAAHLKRNAYLYVRQSTLRQVFENTESTKRQYALRDRAVALGWTLDRIITIDNDLGQSGASAVDRVAEMEHSQVLRVLHNPRYAGAFIYGRTRTRKRPDGKEYWSKLPRDQWVLVPGMHAGYIAWEEYETNQRRLQENAQAHGADRRRSPPHQGPALLQGIVICGICGGRMGVRYHDREKRLVPDYVCQRKAIQQGRPVCQRITGDHVDKAVSEVLVQTMTPLALEVALTVQQELQSRLDEADRLRQKRVERAGYEAELAQRRYMNVDPSNRLVADTLEADWNQKLRALADAQEECERQRQADRIAINEQERESVMALATDFQRVWTNPHTPDRERKRIVRLLLDDVTLVRRQQIEVHIRFRGGVTQSLTLPLPPSAPQLRKTKATVIAEIDRLLNTNTEREIAAILNERGFRPGVGKRFDRSLVIRLRYAYHLKDRFSRLRAAGLMTMEEMASKLEVLPCTVKKWRDRGLLRAYRYNDKGECLYESPDLLLPKKFAHKRSFMAAKGELMMHRLNEVQCEA